MTEQHDSFLGWFFLIMAGGLLFGLAAALAFSLIVRIWPGKDPLDQDNDRKPKK